MIMMATLNTNQVVGDAGQGPMKLHMLTNATADDFGAKCLDGSNFGFYFEASKNEAAKNKWVFMLEGGGVCYTASNCQWRKNSPMGSSEDFEEHFDEHTVLSNDPANPFRDWNHVYLNYCTGDSWTGTQRGPGKHDLQFAGKNNIAATIAVLKEGFGLRDADKTVFSGTSAGGIGVNNNCDWFAAQLENASTVCNPQAGLFFPDDVVMELQNIMSDELLQALPATADITNLGISALKLPANAIASIMVVSLFESSDNLDESCIQNPPLGLKHLCWGAPTALQHISTPTFVVQNFWDSYQLGILCHKGGDDCSEEYRAIYRNSSVTTVSELVESRPTWGGWMPSCNKHNSDFRMESNRGPMVQGKRMAAALSSWMNASGKPDTLSQRLFIDNCTSNMSDSRPCNPHCSPEIAAHIDPDDTIQLISSSPQNALSGWIAIVSAIMLAGL